MYFVYILYSQQFEKYYIGQTENVEARIERHNQGLVLSTRPYIPWTLSWYGSKDSRSEAVHLEKKLKNLSKDRIKEFIRKYS